VLLIEIFHLCEIVREKVSSSFNYMNGVDFLQTYDPGDKHRGVYKSFRKFDFDRRFSLGNIIESLNFYA